MKRQTKVLIGILITIFSILLTSYVGLVEDEKEYIHNRRDSNISRNSKESDIIEKLHIDEVFDYVSSDEEGKVNFDVNNLSTIEFDKSTKIVPVVLDSTLPTREAFHLKLELSEDKGDLVIDHTYKKVEPTEKFYVDIVSNLGAIGYASLNDANDLMKKISINGVELTKENVLNGSYEAVRPLVLASEKKETELTKDFKRFVVSKQGQLILNEKYIGTNVDGESYKSSELTGKLTIGASTSVEDVLEPLVKRYERFNPNIKVEVVYSNTENKINAILSGEFDISMTSKELNYYELKSLKDVVVAYEAIALVVNVHNPIENLTSEEVYNIFTCKYDTWNFSETIEE